VCSFVVWQFNCNITFLFVELADADLLKGIDLMIASNHYLALENEVIEIYLQRMNPDLLLG
jgi:hypothetical protein